MAQPRVKAAIVLMLPLWLGLEIATETWVLAPAILALAILLFLVILVRSRNTFPYLLVLILGLEQLRVPELGSWGTASKIGGLAVITVYSLLFLAERRRPRMVWSETLGLQIAYVFFMAASIGWAYSPQPVLTGTSTLILLIVLTLLVLDFVRTEADVQKFVQALILYAVFLSLYATYELIAKASGTIVSGLRSEAFSGNPNIAAGYIVMAIGLSLGFATSIQSRKAVSILSGVLGILVVGLLATGSRGGFLALMAILLYTSSQVMGRWRQIVIVVLIGGLLLSLTYLYLPITFELMASRFGFGPASGANPTGRRIELWTSALSLFSDNPLVGVGLSNFETHPDNLTEMNSHGTYPGLLAQGGVIGFSLFLSFVVLTVWNLLKMRRKGERTSLLSNAILGGLLALLAVFVFADGEDDKMFWLLLALTQALQVTCAKQAARQRFWKLVPLGDPRVT